MYATKVKPHILSYYFIIDYSSIQQIGSLLHDDTGARVASFDILIITTCASKILSNLGCLRFYVGEIKLFGYPD